MKYPTVYNEQTTLDMALKGLSLARFGDGELRIAKGGQAISQRPEPVMAKAFRAILAKPPKHVLICLPNLISETPEMWFWHKYLKPVYIDMYNYKYGYGSTWITRPDCAPWINTAEYWDKVKELWRGKDVTLVVGDEKSLTPTMLSEARSLRVVKGPRVNAFGDIDHIEREIGTPTGPVLMCLGATATLLAVRLSAKGVHALDVGHIGMFMRRLEMAKLQDEMQLCQT